MSLSERLRPNVEAAPWVIEEVKKIELRIKELEAVTDRAFNWHRTQGPTEVAELHVAVAVMIKSEQAIKGGSDE